MQCKLISENQNGNIHFRSRCIGVSGKVTISEKIKICKNSPQNGTGGYFFLGSQLEVCGRQISALSRQLFPGR